MKGKGLGNVKKDVREFVKRAKGGIDGRSDLTAEKSQSNTKGGQENTAPASVVNSLENNQSMPGDRMDTSSEDVVPAIPEKVVFSAKGTQFRVDPRYSFVKALGLGAYGVVCSATDSNTKTEVAIKKVAGVFDDQTDAKRIIREIRLLSSMKHDNVLNITDIDEPENYSLFNDVYLMTELMDTDLNKLLRSKHPLLDAQRKFFTYQIFRALKYIHSANILHRDLKPANVLVSENVRYFPDPLEAPRLQSTKR